MLEVLQYIFSSGLIYFGTLLLILVTAGSITSLLRAAFVRSSWSLMEPKFRAMITQAINEARL